MTFDEILAQVIDLLQRQGRVSYRALKLRFDINDDYIEGLKDELIHAQKLALDEDNRVLVWVGESGETEAPPVSASHPAKTPEQPTGQQDQPILAEPLPSQPPTPDAERRQLTVMFCDLADSTKLSGQLDPEDLRDVIRAYQSTCADVIERFDGYIAQHLGDGLMVYFGWPQAHEDDAQRALHAGLGILNAMGGLNASLEQEKGIRLSVRIGIHTGLVVVGEIGSGASQEHLALGETPNVASRIEGMAEPDTVAISAATFQLIEGYFSCQNLGQHDLKGVAKPMRVYRVLAESGAQSRLDIVSAHGLTPLVGREQEVGLLFERWQQAKEGMGQVVLLSGEAGIGKSRLLQVMKDHAAGDAYTLLECRSSPYYQNTALYPITDMLQRILMWRQDDTPQAKLDRLEQTLREYQLELSETVPLFATLLSLPIPEDHYPPLALSPQRQRQKTLETIVAMLLQQTEGQPVLFILEDLHWTDPSTLELLDLLIDQTPTAAIYALLTCRPTFQPPWSSRSYLTQITLNRLSPSQIEHMAERVADGKRLPDEVLQQIVEKTDGVPLYVEEMTKAVLESGVLKEVNGQYALAGSVSSLAIPATLQDSLMARLDRLVTAKAVAQYAAVIGRQFSYALLQAVSESDDATLQRELTRLVQAELLYQRGLPPQATYTFKHALITDAAYQSLLKSTRQQYHLRIAQVLVEQFPETVETQPELVAHHYQGAGSTKQAIHYWQHAGGKAIQRSANTEAIRQLGLAIELLAELPHNAERNAQELDLQMAISAPLLAINGFAAPELEAANTRARELCEMIGQTPKIIPALSVLMRYYVVIGQPRRGFETGQAAERILQQSADIDPAWIAIVSNAVGASAMLLGDYATAVRYEQYGVEHSDIAYRDTQILTYGEDMGTTCRGFLALVQWCLGYPDQARAMFQQARDRAEQFSHAFSIAWANTFSLVLDMHFADACSVRERATSTYGYAVEHGLPSFQPICLFMQGWAIATQDQDMAGVIQMEQMLAMFKATGYTIWGGFFRGLLAEAHHAVGQTAQAVQVIDAAIELFNRSEEGYGLAEVHRLKGLMLLQQGGEDAIRVAEACFHQALAVARAQQAKSWELRAASSLARLWQSQDKRQDAYDLLAPVYNWFTEGFDTADLQEAKALLDKLA